MLSLAELSLLGKRAGEADFLIEGDSEGGRLSATGIEDRGRRVGEPDLTPVTTAKLLFPVYTHPPL